MSRYDYHLVKKKCGRSLKEGGREMKALCGNQWQHASMEKSDQKSGKISLMTRTAKQRLFCLSSGLFGVNRQNQQTDRTHLIRFCFFNLQLVKVILGAKSVILWSVISPQLRTKNDYWWYLQNKRFYQASCKMWGGFTAIPPPDQLCCWYFLICN